MSVSLDSINGKIGETTSNGQWMATIKAARILEGDKIPDWDGFHDGGHEWTPDQLTIIANRMEQLGGLAPVLRTLAANGGVKIS